MRFLPRPPLVAAVLVLTACAGGGATPPESPSPAPVPAPTSAGEAAWPGLAATGARSSRGGPHLGALEAAIRQRASETPGEVSVMLVDLETGATVGVQPDVSMHAASTMKVPVVLELFRQAAAGRFDLDRSVTVKNTFTSIADSSTYSLSPDDDSEAALYRLVGRQVTLRDLAERMITRSSNLATNLLIEKVGANSVRRLMHGLGTDSMVVLRGVEDIPAFERGMNNHTTARALAGVLEALARCERGDVAPALRPLTASDCGTVADILARQEFNEKIPAGIPAGVRVAHKTGWITGIDHDAGIVYPPGRAPYVLAILTRGVDSTAVADAAARDISRLVWNALAQPDTKAAFPDADPQTLAELQDRWRVAALDGRKFTHDELWGAVGPIIDRSPVLQRAQVGASEEGRPIYAVTYGSGPRTVLLWSQMHGDESTATMALADIVAWLGSRPTDALARRLADSLTVVMVPMLNPDGAERFQRRNAQGIDVNRDARRLATPEGRVLKALRDSLRPDFGFNLHDQNVRTRAGSTGPVASIALLAPAFGPTSDFDDVRDRARHVAAAVRLAMEPFVGDRIAKYDDTFNPRAFGDLMQQWGTSTVLIESGGFPDDPEKQMLRKVNFVGILAALDAIATDGYRSVDPAWYGTLPYNTGGLDDLLVRGGTLVVPGLDPYRADLAIRYRDPLLEQSGRIVDAGDLGGYEARDTLDATGLFIHPAAPDSLPPGDVTGAPAQLVVRRGPEPTSPAVWIVEDGGVRRAEPVRKERP